ncbi:glycosyl transferase [Spirochaetia bacterium]|nr:glycosyl transferase [Spirochaetia bacterium]
MNVSIIIVNYNTKALLKQCLESIYKQTKYVTFEIIISDNASTDDSVSMIKNNFPKVILIKNEKNLGFGAGNNRCLSKAIGEFVFYLNSDTIMLNNAVKIFFDFWKKNENQKTLGALGCILLNDQHLPTHSYGNFSSATNELKEKCPWSSRKAIEVPITPPAEVDYITGAALFMKNDQYACFDERFFLYFDDSDLQLGLAKINKKRMVIPGPQIVHLEGGSNSSHNKITFQGSFSRIQFAISKIKYYKKRKDNPAAIFILKMFTIIKWLNPLILRSTFKYFPELLKT